MTRLGMPQLAYAGLSETWLLRDCGDRHWLAIAARLGLADPDFRDADGRSAYAAFLGLRLTQARLGAAREHDRLDVQTRLSRPGPARHLSVHDLHIGPRCIARVELLSTFVGRLRPGDNRSVARVSVPADTTGDKTGDAADDAADNGQSDGDTGLPPLAQRVRALRAGVDLDAEGLLAPPATLRFSFTPCPRNDFNGAGFLYFANFAAVLDRAAWDWWREAPQQTTAVREIAWFGNLNVGETLHVGLLGVHHDGPGAGHACELRAGDGRLLARALTRRRPASASAPEPQP